MENILRGLVKREKAEKDFIDFYEVFMKDDFSDRLSEEHRQEFVEHLKSLRDESRRHYELVRNIIKKHDKAKLFSDEGMPVE